MRCYHAGVRPLLALAFVVVFGGGCSLDERSCTGPAYCSGTVLHECVPLGNMFHGYDWRTIDCAGTARACVDPADGGDAFCALSSSPDPRCSGGTSSWCDGSILVACRAGFLDEQHDCTPSVCAAPLPNRAGCYDPSARCFDEPDGWICEDRTAFLCSAMVATEALSCTACAVVDGRPVGFDGGACR
jgi:hypothetical protein